MMEIERNTILVGNVMERLRELPSDSVHCVVTSPPYYGLRSYGTPPQVWGGDADCEHDWGSEERGKRKDLKPREESSSESRMGTDERQGVGPPSGGRFCLKCNAWLGELGQEPTLDLYVEHMVEVFREVRRVLRSDSVCLLNLGDSYAANRPYQVPSTKGGKKHGPAQGNQGRGSEVPEGMKAKDLMMVPATVAIALRKDGWWLRGEYIWHKPSCMPSSVEDRCTTSHEYVYHLAKSANYFWDHVAIREPHAAQSIARVGRTHHTENHKYADGGPGKQTILNRFDNALHPSGRNKRSVWTFNTSSFSGSHFAVMPSDLVSVCVKAGTSEHGVCGECGTPYVRVVEKGEQNLEQARAAGADASGGYNGKAVKEYDGTGAQNASDVKRRVLEGMRETRTVGWERTCECASDEIKPAIVLDPFLGSGTVGMVARELGRDWLGVELNEDYAEMARECIEKGRKGYVKEAVEKEAGQAMLF